ncbi:MAG: 3-methyladenine DNA glycosylase [Gordonia sp. (in: high G+C Gram-positive bacteria)]
MRRRDQPDKVLSASEWTSRSHEHRERVEALIGPYLRDRRRGIAHPVLDFLFTYYSARPSHVLRWHAGFGVVLAPIPPGVADTDPGERRRISRRLDEYAGLRGYRRDEAGVSVDPAYAAARRSALQTTVELLTATASRPVRLGCFGLHEWAMVYRTDRPRHSVPLRLGAAGTDAIVESMPLRCTHYDAFRFFTDAARPRNERELTGAGRISQEQPGCLHATMDLYRVCLTLSPLLPSELTLRAFELALVARELDMRASPYDLRDFGYAPVAIETAAGRADYIREQSLIAEAGAALRTDIAVQCRALLDTT